MSALASNTKYVQFLNVLNSDGFFGSAEELVLSPWLDLLCVVTHQKDALLYPLPSIETCIEPVWQCPSKVERCLFSEDGKNILAILRVNSFQIYQVTDNSVSLLVQMKACELMKVFNNWSIEFSAASDIKGLLFKKQSIILMMDKKLVVMIKWSTFKGPAVTYSIPVDMHRDICLNDKFIFVLNNVGLIKVARKYNLSIAEQRARNTRSDTIPEGGHFLCSTMGHDVYSTVSGEVLSEVIAGAKEEPKLFKVRVHPNAAVLAGVNEAEETVLLDIKEVEGSGSRKRTDGEVRKEKWSWTYKGGRKRTDCKGSGTLRRLGKVGAPAGLVVAQLQFSIRGLFAFYGIMGQARCSSLKVIEESSGSVLYSFEGLVESRVVSGGPLPLIYSESILSMCLGALCRDDVIVRLCNVLWGVSKESEPGVGCREWEGPFDFHWVFLKIVVRLHRNLFRWDLKKLRNRGERKGKVVGPEGGLAKSRITERVYWLLKVVMEAKRARGTLEAEAREKMLVECFVHAVGLLDIALVEGGNAVDCDLFSELLHQVLALFEDVRAVDPLRNDWANWREMTDVEVIRDACSMGVPGVAHVFLVVDRGWLGSEVENKFRKEAHVWVVELIRAKNLEKAGRVLRNLGFDSAGHLKRLARSAKDPTLRDILIGHLNNVGECDAEELEAWDVARKVESAISSAIKRYHVFDHRMNVSSKNQVKAMAVKLPAYQGSIDLTTLLNCSQDWRDALFSELYFHTGDAVLEKTINKRSCWQYLIRSNQVDMLKKWINVTGGARLESLSKSFDYLKKKIYQLFAQWPVTEDMVNDVIEADCMTSTKCFVLDTCAFYGIFATKEKRCMKKLVRRLDNQSLLEDVRTILSKATSNVNVDDFEDMVFERCMSHELRSIALTCLEKPRPSEVPSDMLWVATWKSFCYWAQAGDSKKPLRDAIAKCSLVYGCGSTFESSLLDLAVALVDDKEISDVIESQGNECPLLRLPLMNSNWKSADSTDRQSADVTLYDLLKSSQVSANELYLWQSQNKHATASSGHVDVFAEFPHFNHQVLTIKFGFKQNLDHIYYLKQGRPSFACNLFVVESLRTQRRLTTKMVKRVCGVAHGLALRRWKDKIVGNGCVAFIAMLGDIAASNFLRVHLGAIQCTYEYLPDDMGYYISTLARGIAGKHLPHLQEMACILEKSIMLGADKKKMVALLEKWSLAVSFCNIHSLPLPSLLLKNLARRHDWFSFMTCMDLFKYPYEQAIDLIEEITSKVLKSHLIRAITRTTLKLSTTSPTKSPPKILLEPESNGKEDQETLNGKDVKDTFQSFVTNIYTEILNTIQTFTDKNIVLPWSCEQDPDSDLLLTLLKCESEADTSKSLLTSSMELQSPALAVFATCFQCDNIFPNMMAWLVSSVPTCLSRMRRREEGQRLVDRVYGPKEVETLLLHFFSTGYFQTFFRGMNLFMSENPISLFLNAVYHSVVLLDWESGKELLKGFVLELGHFPTKEASGNFTRSLVLDIVAQCIENLLTRADLQNTTKRRFLRVLAESELSSVDSGFPNYLLWSQICDILECSEANLGFVQLYDLTTVTEELQNCLDVLMKNRQFSQALEICSLLSLNRDQFVVAMWKNQIEVSVHTSGHIEKVWRDSCSAFKDENVNPNLAASFYYDMASVHDMASPESLKNRYLALKYCLHWRRFIEDTLSASFKEESDAIELDMWRCCIEENFEVALLRNEEPFEVTQALGMSIWASGKVLVPAQALEPVERQRVEYLINFFLDEGDLRRAMRLSAFFKSANQDLMLITSCLKIILQEGCPCDVHQFSLDTSVVASKISLQLKPMEELESNEQHRMLFLLDSICQAVNHGKALAHKFFVCYRLSVNLDLTLKDIASERDYLGILPRWVSLAGANKLSVASDLITLADLPTGELAKYLREKIVSAIMEVHSTDLAVPSTLWGVSLESDFHLIIGLMSNPSTLGSELLQASTSLSCSHGVELLIRAHNCFAACCNVEGIGRVLRRARILASVALQAGQWQHLVRLLIGIERYSDMSYIFEMLKDNGQFEQLLRKGMQKVPGLHVAISEFLQRYCPQDKELGKMVAAHFGLHSKLAGFWQKEADEIISQLPVSENALKDTLKTRDLLNLAAEYYSHAAHWFLQAGKLNRALKVAHRAQIVAMQISLLGGPFILMLQSRADLQPLLNGSLSVAQSLIISRACDLDPDWISAVHERWVLKGDKTFLCDLKSHSLFSSQLVSSYLQRYNPDDVTNGKAKVRMKQLMTSFSHTPSPMANDLNINQLK